VARADQFLGLEECDRPRFVSSLNPNDPPGGIANLIAEVVRRVAAGSAKPDVLAVFGSRAALPLFSSLSQTRSTVRQQRIQRALLEIAPAIVADKELVEMFDLMFWSSAGARRYRAESLASAQGSPVADEMQWPTSTCG
jgi:hypothetical protein